MVVWFGSLPTPLPLSKLYNSKTQGIDGEFWFRSESIIERLDQGHLYPLGERRDKHVTDGPRTSALLHRRRTLYLKSYLDSL